MRSALAVRALFGALLISSSISVTSSVRAQLFASPVNYPVGDVPFGLACGDLDGDGRPDVVTGNLVSGDISILRNLGNGTLGPAFSIPVGGDPHQISIGELDGDGCADIAVGRHGASPCLVLFWNDEDGGFTVPVPVGSFSTLPDGIRIVDLDGDEDNDILLSSVTGGVAVVFVNLGDRNFGGGVFYELETDPAYPSDLAVGDLDGDNELDFAVSASLSQNPPVFVLGNGDATFREAQPYAAAVGEVISVAIGDVNRDQLADLVALNASANSIDVYGNDGGPAFSITGSYPIECSTQFGGKVRVADLDGDGWLDAAVAPILSNPVIPVLLGDGAGGFGAPTHYAANFGMSALELVDLDGDADLDIVGASKDSDRVTVLRNQSPTPVGADAAGGRLEFECVLLGPNPTDGATSIAYRLPRASDVRISIHGASGRLVRSLVDARVEAGAYRASWDGRTDGRSVVEPGVYFYRMVAGPFVSAGKVEVLR